ncbi:MAG: polysaccharide biosynthesis protein [Clostridia bacterium]|nr:polysaccharide biosynthesis protein [Clostridia bacterium]
MVLGSSMVIVKIMGMIYKILLSNMYGGVGTGLFNSAYALYNPLFMLSTAGFPIAISRMVSESITKKRYRDVRQIHKLSVPIFVIAGLLCFLAMVIGSFIYVKIIKAENTIFALLCLSPTIFFGCLMSIYRGYFEGMRNMAPTAISEVIEASCKLFLGFTASYFTMQICLNQYHSSGYVLGIECASETEAHNAAVPLAIGAAITGISLGSLFGFVFLFIKYKRIGDGISVSDLRSSPPPRSNREIITTMVKTAIPIGLGSIIMSLADMIDSTLVNKRIYSIMETNPDALLNVYGSLIPDDVYYSNSTHTYLYGCYGIALTLMMLVTAVTQVFGTTALPSVTAAWTSGNKERMKQSMETVLRVTVLVTIPSGIGMSVLAEPLLSLIYSGPAVANEVEIGSKVLAVMGISVIFIATSTPLCSMLQAVGRMDVPLKLFTIGMIMKIIVNYILVGIPEINIQGANVGSIVCYGFVTVVAMFILCRETKITPNFNSILIKPLLAAIICGVAAYFAEIFFDLFLVQKAATIMAILVAIVVYIISLLLLRAIKREDILQMPKGNKILKVLEKHKLIR